LNKSLTALNALPLLILKIFEYKLVIVPVVDDNVVIVPDGVVIDGIVAAPFWFTNHDLVESETLINPNVELLL
jgi:hypothetical protein